MVLARSDKRIKKERQQVYFDLISGVISSIVAISGIICVGLTQEITNFFNFVAVLSFWIFYLSFSIFMIGFGTYLWHREKNFDELISKKDIEVPILS